MTVLLQAAGAQLPHAGQTGQQWLKGEQLRRLKISLWTGRKLGRRSPEVVCGHSRIFRRIGYGSGIVPL